MTVRCTSRSKFIRFLNGVEYLRDYRGSFSRFKRFKSLWIFDKNAICEKFVSRGYPLVKIDEKFIFYANIIADLRKLKTYHDVGAIRINLQPLLDSICSHSLEWKNTLGEILADRTRKNMIEQRDEMKVSRLLLI